MGRWGKYIFVLVLTVGLFGVSWYVSLYFNQRKVEELRMTQDKIAIDILSSETQFDLLEELSCQDLGTPLLSDEIAELASKLSYSEQNIGTDEQINLLKEQYSILEVKDYLLSKRIGERCGHKPTTVFYFYGDKQTCPNCDRQGYVLDTIRQEFPELRVYSFDYTLDTPTIQAMRSIYKVKEPLPALVVNGKTYTGFKTLEELEALLPKDFVKAAQDKAAAEAKEKAAATKPSNN